MIKKTEGTITGAYTKNSEKAGLYESIEVTADDNKKYYKNYFVNHSTLQVANRNILFLDELFKTAGFRDEDKKYTKFLVGARVVILVDDEDQYKNIKTISVIK